MPLAEIASPEPKFTFGPFNLLTGSKVLLESGRPVRLGVRAMQILIALVEHAGQTLTKRDLLGRVWPDSLVEESNLRVHIAALRKVLGDGRDGIRYILNDAGRGYRFVAPVARAGVASELIHSAPPPGSGLTPSPARVVGRDEVTQAIAEQLPRRRLVTIVGPGGVGKTTVALAVVRRVLDASSQAAAVVNLAAVDDPAMVPVALATAVGISAITDDPLASLIAFLAEARTLIVLDNCEHVLAAVAVLAERIVKGTVNVQILATSREPLLADFEWVYRLPPLALPTVATATVAAALASPAVRCFIERAAIGGESFELTGQNVGIVVRICRSLDGLPLALELAAAQVHVFGLEGLAAQLSDHLLLLTKGRRPTRPQHQSIRTTLDWSYGLLSAEEKRVLRAIAVFKGAFTSESAAAVADGAAAARSAILESLISLADKSLLITDVGGPEVLFRLLHITRAYATEKLLEEREQAVILRRHASHCCVVLEAAQAEWESMTREEWLDRYQHMIDDVRAALDWTFSADGELDLGVSLTSASLPFGFQLCQIAEFKKRAELALERLTGASPRQPLAELRLNVALGALYKNTEDSEEGFLRAYARAEELAQNLGILKYKVETLVARTVSRIEQGNTPAAVAASDELQSIAARAADPIVSLIADRAAAQAQHFAGRQTRAREFVARVLDQPARSIPLAYSHAAVDRRVWMRIVLARADWLEGRVDRAAQIARECLDFARTDGPFAKAHALALAAVPIAFWRGELSTARQLAAELVEHCRRYTLSRWLKLGQCYQSAAAALGEEPALRLHRGGHGPFSWPANPLHYDLLATICDDWVDAETIRRASEGVSGWCAPEVLRVAGELARRSGSDDARVTAEDYFRRSLRLAAEQGALSWELRSAMSLAELYLGEGRSADAHALLDPVRKRFVEGLETADLMLASRLADR